MTNYELHKYNMSSKGRRDKTSTGKVRYKRAEAYYKTITKKKS